MVPEPLHSCHLDAALDRLVVATAVLAAPSTLQHRHSSHLSRVLPRDSLAVKAVTEAAT